MGKSIRHLILVMLIALLVQQCETNNEPDIEIDTGTSYGITQTSAFIEGKIIDAGTGLLQYGHCWSESREPTPQLSTRTEFGSSKTDGTFTSELKDLIPGKKYYVRAYGINRDHEEVYGNHIEITTQSMEVAVVITLPASSITDQSFQSGGNITDDGGAEILYRGVCWNSTGMPTISDNLTQNGTGTGEYSSSVEGLSCGTTYFVRAYATNSVGTSYGESISITTSACPEGTATVTTAQVTNISTNSAQSGGEVVDEGSAGVTSRGICWNLTGNPTVEDQKTMDGSGAGSFSSSLSALACETTYYVRAYATNSEGTAYGNQVEFTTGTCPSLPTVTTASVTSITNSSAEGGGNVTDNGGSAISARGICWSTAQNPTTSDEHADEGTGTGSFTVSLNDLTCETTYYVRAYATNSEGTAYGNQVEFTTGSCPSLPTVTTASVTNITASSAACGGNVTDDGGSAITAKGVCWSTTPTPTISDNKTSDGSGTGSYVSTMTGLAQGVMYYVRAYATNSEGTSYGAERTFTTWTGSVTDYDGNTYPVVEIGTQTWMASNLRSSHYANGDLIPLLTNVLDWTATEDGAYSYYSNDESAYGETYGALYNWMAVDDDRNICPSGWHVPTNSDWVTLIDYAGGNEVAGAKLKEEGSAHWSNNTYSTNEYGFTALPGGDRDQNGNFGDLTYNGKWWTSDIAVEFPTQRYYYQIDGSGYNITRLRWYPNAGYSVRCVKD